VKILPILSPFQLSIERMPRPWVRSHHVVVFVCAATGADRARGRRYFSGYRCVVRRSRFIDPAAKHAFAPTVLLCRRQQGTRHAISG